MNNAYYWLSDFLAQQDQHATLKIESFIPPVFDHYYLIEHNYGIIDDFPFDTYPEDMSSMDNLNKRHEIEKQFGLFPYDHSYRQYPFRAISIREIAARFNIPYSYNTYFELKSIPAVAPLHDQTKEVWRRFLGKLLRTDLLNVFITDPHQYAAELLPNDKFSSLDLSTDYRMVEDLFNSEFTTYMFPDDKKWCFISIGGLWQKVFACDATTSSLVPEISGLEYFETAPGLELIIYGYT